MTLVRMDNVLVVVDDLDAAIALTDHGSMYGVIPFYASARKPGIKQIIGIETYVPRSLGA
jgi:DNA polymerase III alpha subunit